MRGPWPEPAPAPPVQLPPPPPPPPPPVRRTRWWLAAIPVLVWIVVGAIVAGGDRDRDDATEAVPTGRGEHAFLQEVGGEPYRWNPCEPIHWAVNLEGAPSGAATDVRQAVDAVSRATGIRFVFDGESTVTARAQLGSRFIDDAQPDGWRPLLIAWASDGFLRELSDKPNLLGVGIPHEGNGEFASQYVSGLVILNREPELGLHPGFGGIYAEGVVLLHELGHVMGLAHVKDPRQVMYSGKWPQLGTTAFGDGDLEGLRLLGRSAGCMKHASRAS